MTFKKLHRHLRLQNSSNFHPNPEAGMTIIEILIVIALIGTIMTIVVTSTLNRQEEAKVDLTKTAQGVLQQSFIQYKLHNNKFPSTDEGLRALIEAPPSAKGWRGPYTDADKFNDAFNNEMQYELVTAGKFKLTSAGIDGEFNTPDDIIFPKEFATQNEAPASAELTVPAGQNQVP